MNSSPSSCPIEVDVKTVKSRLDTKSEFVLLDCRRQDEYEFVHLEGAVFIPMDELPSRLAELGEDQGLSVVVYCHHGGRSLMVARWLRQQGWEQAQSMAGGIDSWAEEIDPSLPRYG